MLSLALLLAQAVIQPEPAVLTPRPPVEDLARALELRAELLGAEAPKATVRPDGTVLLDTPNIRLDPAVVLGAGELAVRVKGKASGAEHLGVQEAWVEPGSLGFWTLTIVLDAAGTQSLAEFTRAQVNQEVGIFVAGRHVSPAVLLAPIEQGRILLQGAFSQREAERILAGLQLPWRARLLE
jgi:preprotein translocase subunit SecD